MKKLKSRRAKQAKWLHGGSAKAGQQRRAIKKAKRRKRRG